MTAFLTTNWAAVSSKPLPFILVAIIAFGLGLTVASLFAAQRVAVADERRQLAEDETRRYRDKLEGRTPDEAAKTLQRLEQQVAALQPWTIGPARLDLMAPLLKVAPGRVSITMQAGSSHLRTAWEETARFFRSVGWDAEASTLSGASLNNSTIQKYGTDPLSLIIYGDKERIPHLPALRRALDATGLDYSINQLDTGADRLEIRFQAVAP